MTSNVIVAASIADEITTEFGCTEYLFACDYMLITQDIIGVCKGLTRGYLSVAVTITTQENHNAFYADDCVGRAFLEEGGLSCFKLKISS